MTKSILGMIMQGRVKSQLNL